jgi:hypothetical protein
MTKVLLPVMEKKNKIIWRKRVNNKHHHIQITKVSQTMETAMLSTPPQLQTLLQKRQT